MVLPIKVVLKLVKVNLYIKYVFIGTLLNNLIYKKPTLNAAEIKTLIKFAKKIGASKGDVWDNNLGKSSRQDMVDRFRKPDPTNMQKFDDSARATTSMEIDKNPVVKNLKSLLYKTK